ncbi:MAG: LmeA family phospholipid-binding protein, partial [Actinomycetes bacterium]
GDLVAARMVADEAEKRLRSEGFVAPQVKVHGFPVLTQIARRRFDDVSMRAESLSVEGGRATDVRAQASGLVLPDGGSGSMTGLTARGTVPYAEVAEAAGLERLRLEAGDAGKVRLSRPVQVLGETLDVAGQARIEARGSTVRLTPTDVEVRGGEPADDQLSALLAERIAIDYRIPDLPDGVRVESVTAAEAGLVVRVTGRDLVVPTG